ncbi:MAG: sugar phosphate isomerase/epimerase family protein [Armatimonadota bacterium]
MRFGCCAGLDNMGIVESAGYDYIELGVGTVKPESPTSEFEPIKEQIMSYKIKPEAWNCLLPGDLRVTGPDVDKYRQERYLLSAFERIGKVGGIVVVFGSGGARKVPEGFPVDEAKEQIKEFMLIAGKAAETYGITLVLEPLNKKETNIVNSVAEGAELVRAVDYPSMKLLADLYHVDEENEPLQNIIDAGDLIKHTHTADTGRLYPGSGSYDHKGFFTALKSIGYNDRMSVECIFKDFESECRKSIEFLRKIDAETN